MIRLNFNNFMTLILATFISFSNSAQTRKKIALTENWKFQKGDQKNAQAISFNDTKWQKVSVPHDWAIYGPFDKEIDKQNVAISQNGEKNPTEKTGRTGSLPHIGTAWYRNEFSLSAIETSKKIILLFEGAMSEPEVFINGKKVGEWKYGYSYFYFDISENIVEGKNTIAVKLTNKEFASRWYPGAGLYRNVRMIIKNQESIAQWGTFITTPFVTDSIAKINIKTSINSDKGFVKTTIFDAQGKALISQESSSLFGNKFEQNIPLINPKLWSPETPYLYTAKTEYFVNNKLSDEITTRFGVRKIEYNCEKGFVLNDKITKFKGVCLHHDLGPLGTAINKAALKRQLLILKDMGVNAIRSSHNMPSFEQLELADELGFLFLAESFDEWKKPKVENGYNLFFDEYAEKDIVNLVHATRNHPSIVMWSSGNEVPDQWGSEGVKRAKWLQDIFHREDPTRPVTVGMDQVKAVMESGFGAILDIPGLNYRVHLYEEAYKKFPQGFILGSETASTVSSRGIYKFPVEKGSMKQYNDFQSSSYDLEYCSWSNLPEDDFILQDDKPWVIGEFVWTGFDYLGEPTPYDEKWPSRSSYFGMIDLAGIPKDRYYLYRSRWNTKAETLHILPHWNWEGREGEKTPVFVYSNYESAELFVNGKSQGIQNKIKNGNPQERYRLLWNDVVYEPGIVKVVAFDKNGKAVAEKEVKTAGKPHKIVLEADRKTIKSDGKDLSFVTVSVVDKNGIPCPTATNQLQFEVKGKGTYRAACNGDATSLELFHLPTMKLFSGKLVVIVQSKKEAGKMELKVSGKGLKMGVIELEAVLND
ncbi:MAG: glycoside hydrolase family 2 protein [Flavobacteriia bacterium]|nr:glycoside hydrolase family 2 protein [Flavobacteriia bacterium]OIP46076.1 MAG: beta-galactosidase [Flavobacteriaceae bacterium CG2_30_31_66]PIV96880.1 MAG: beta-galactosidase [Flavobacteriaceae bacterium CG17_big_fil_post_rev_8_21_14_2_50_31_13]PIX12705.1 MAG: beta-galactosidase [Flavobacteriaceae bacterium CG_4_8_14_3_um_filter_31_8]PIY15187.1 MAG: beta-galactosidase [Flavobacteriaceae bacterium CG_4_10_14_3_um_filter_31_253]PIZ09679.1 MAG: beta-galactosidase [Flavobacteriaceae bacterium C